jgi:hypothetical protein
MNEGITIGGDCECCETPCECIMCGTGEDCGETRTVTITHGADLIEMTHFDSQDEEGGTTLAEIMASMDQLAATTCAPITETEVYPYCSFRGTGTLGLYLYTLLFFFDGADWILRIQINNTAGGGGDATHYLEENLGVSDVDCATFEEEYIVPRCTGDTGGNPDETILVTIAA